MQGAMSGQADNQTSTKHVILDERYLIQAAVKLMDPELHQEHLRNHKVAVVAKQAGIACGAPGHTAVLKSAMQLAAHKKSAG